MTQVYRILARMRVARLQREGASQQALDAAKARLRAIEGEPWESELGWADPMVVAYERARGLRGYCNRRYRRYVAF